MSGEVPKKNNSEALKKISIKQFQWYEVQTKVRQLLTELLQPFTKKQAQDTVKMNEFKRVLATNSKKIEDHDFLLTQQNAQKPTYVQMQDDKIQQMHQKMIESQIQQNKKISDMQKITQIYEAKINQVNKIQTRIDEQIKQRSSSFKEHKDYVNQQINLMMKKLDDQDSQFNNLRQTTRNALNKVQTKIVVLQNRTNANEEQLKRKTQQIRRTNQQVTNMNQKLAATDLCTKQLDLRLLQREKDYKLSQKFMTKAVELQNDVNFISNYLQYYQPLYSQMQISETINSFLKGTMKVRASLYEQKVFAHMHQAILNLQEESLETRMSDYSNRIRRIINRNKKFLIRMKVEQTFKYGNNVYEIREIDQNLLDQAEEQSSKPAPMVVPEEEINNIIELKWQKIMKSLEHKIEQKTSPFQVWMKQLQEQALMKQVQIQKKYNELKGRQQSQEATIQLFKTDIKQIQKEGRKSTDAFSRDLKKVKQQIKDVINFSSVINHIVIQDEIDRQGMALYALKTGSNQASKNEEQTIEQAYPSIRLDQKCVSCQNGNSSMIVNQAFKMACLAYNPSQIKVDDRSFSREQILQISTNILDKLKKKVDEVDSIEKKEPTLMHYKNSQSKSRSKSLISRQLNNTRNEANNSTLQVPPSSRLRDTTYLLPILGTTKKRASGLSNRDKIVI